MHEGKLTKSYIALCLVLLSLLFCPLVAATASSSDPVVLKAYRARVIPTIDGRISDGEWEDTALLEEHVSRANVAFKHDGEYLYVLAVYEDNTPSPNDYLGLELDQNSDEAHMGTEENPDYSIFTSPSFGDSHGVEAWLPGMAKPIFFEHRGLISRVEARMLHHEGEYVVELKRPFKRGDDIDGDIQLGVGRSIGIGFVTGEFGKGTAHRATDMSSYSLKIVSEEYAGEEMGIAFDIYGFAATYGQYFQYAAVVAVVLHFVRRRAWNGVENEGAIDIERHNIFARVAHWIRVSALTVLVLSGWSTFLGQPLLGAATYVMHVAAGSAILLADVPLHIYSMSKNGEWRRLLLPNRDDLQVTMVLVKNFFGLTKDYPPHAVYDKSTNDYFMGRKYCSLQKLLMWGYVPTLGGLGLTGFALWYPDAFTWVFGLLGGGLAVRGVHLLLFYVFTSVFLVHIYLSLIPANWHRLKAIVRGSCSIPVLEESRELPSAPRISRVQSKH
ncbi:MAG: cytochrome b/b6 domain-containing protein [Candidatus Geothermarchaeales archaeon]